MTWLLSWSRLADWICCPQIEVPLICHGTTFSLSVGPSERTPSPRHVLPSPNFSLKHGQCSLSMSKLFKDNYLSIKLVFSEKLRF